MRGVLQPRVELGCANKSSLVPSFPLTGSSLTLAEQLADSSGAGIARGDVDGTVAVNSGGRLQRRARLDQGQDGGRVTPHGGVVERPVPVHVFGVSVSPFLQEPDHNL